MCDTTSENQTVMFVQPEYPWTEPFTIVPHTVRKKMAIKLDKKVPTQLCGWEELGERLGLGADTITHYRDKPGDKDRTSYILEEYCTQEDNSVWRMLELLIGMGRHDAATYLKEWSDSEKAQRQIATYSSAGQGPPMTHRSESAIHNSPSMAAPFPDNRSHGMLPIMASHPVPQQASGYLQQPQAPSVVPVSNAWSVQPSFNTKDEPMDTDVYPHTLSGYNQMPRDQPLDLAAGIWRGEHHIGSVADPVSPGGMCWSDLGMQPTPTGSVEMHSGCDPRIGFPNMNHQQGRTTERPLDLSTGCTILNDLEVRGQPVVPYPAVIVKREPNYDAMCQGPPCQFTAAQQATVKQEVTPLGSAPCVFQQTQLSPCNWDEQLQYNSSSSSSNNNSSGSAADSLEGLCHTFKDHGLNTYPRKKTKNKTKDKNSDTIGSSLMRASMSADAFLESNPYRQGGREVRVFLTYSYDDRSHMKRVLDMYHCLCKNKFSVSLDETERDLVPRDQALDHLRHRYTTAKFILVCISPKYFYDVNSFAHQPSQDPYKLNALYIHRLMERELRQQNRRIIPVIFEQSGATKQNIPPLLASMFRYRWPKQYRHLLYHLMDPEKVLERLISHGRPHLSNFPPGSRGNLTRGPTGEHYSG